MSASSAPPSSSVPARSGMVSLYANLLDPSSSNAPDAASTTPASISRAPVVFKQTARDDAQLDDVSTKKQQINPDLLTSPCDCDCAQAAALRFQPTKRPQVSSQKPKPKSSFPKHTPSFSSASPPNPGTSAPPPLNSSARAPVKSTLADWTATGDDDDDVNGFYAGEKRQRGGRKKRKKNKEEFAVPQNWDDIYDPARPNSYEEYKHSEEKIREVREWKDRLYAHRMARRHSSDVDSDDEPRARPAMNQFAPPSNYSFAPPPSFDSDPESSRRPATPPPPPAEGFDDGKGEDAYARRLRLTQQHQQQSLPPAPARIEPSDTQTSIVGHPASPPPTAQDQPAGGPEPTISRAPVRYKLPTAPTEIPASEAELEEAIQREESDDNASEQRTADETPRSLRPGQKGFAQRLMSKYGWTKGSGLGASGSGIINPLQVKVDKQKKKPDSEGGGFVGPKGMGKVFGGKKKTGESDEGKFGAMSDVVVLRGMVDGMDLDAELEGTGDGGLMQEIGEECGEKYGRVERVFIDRESKETPKVFVRFTSQLSALRAVNALEGRIFNGNAISARFFDAEKFEMGQYQ